MLVRAASTVPPSKRVDSGVIWVIERVGRRLYRGASQQSLEGDDIISATKNQGDVSWGYKMLTRFVHSGPSLEEKSSSPQD